MHMGMARGVCAAAPPLLRTLHMEVKALPLVSKRGADASAAAAAVAAGVVVGAAGAVVGVAAATAAGGVVMARASAGAAHGPRPAAAHRRSRGAPRHAAVAMVVFVALPPRGSLEPTAVSTRTARTTTARRCCAVSVVVVVGVDATCWPACARVCIQIGIGAEHISNASARPGAAQRRRRRPTQRRSVGRTLICAAAALWRSLLRRQGPRVEVPQQQRCPAARPPAACLLPACHQAQITTRVGACIAPVRTCSCVWHCGDVVD